MIPGIVAKTAAGVNSSYLVITYKFLRRRESGLLDECTTQILRFAQDDSLSIVILSEAKDLLPTYG